MFPSSSRRRNISNNTNNIKYEIRDNGRNKLDKRRARKFHEKLLIYFYYTNKVPTEYLNNIFWTEHIFIFSSSWDNEIDIDRLGNIIPIIESLNKARGTKHIKEYEKLDTHKFMQYIKDIMPSTILYNQITIHDDKKVHIKDSKKFNEFCESNEKKIINCFLNALFR